MSEGIVFARRSLAGWHLESTVAGTAAADAVMAAAELLANAVDHAGGPLALDLGRHGGHLRVAVTDPSSAPPHLHEQYRPDAVNGHGLVIVDRVAAAWGCTFHDGGKTVWAELALSPVGGPDPGRARRAALADPDPLFDN
ncbi:ATP-binding protein [Kitasatospora sp. KL5]|uniref:ATP-binding protein n=1 Tax=Kitasatospora sp. KL5 TaxID=3425125 RepID=UPI003D6F6EE6